MCVVAAATAILVRRTVVGRLTGAESAAALGVALLATGVALQDRLTSASLALLLATALAAGCTAALHLVGLRVARVGGAVVTVLAWLSLTGSALTRALDHDASWTQLWGGGHVWPLLASAATVAVIAAVRRVPIAGRVSAAALAQSLLVCAALAPAERLSPTGATLVGLGILAGAGALTLLLPSPWGRVNLLTQLVVGGAVLAVALGVLDRCAHRLSHVVDPVWAGSAGDVLARTQTSGLPAAWLLPLCTLALLGTGYAAVRGLEAAPHDLRRWLQPAVIVLGGSVVAGCALHPVPVWLCLLSHLTLPTKRIV